MALCCLNIKYKAISNFPLNFLQLLKCEKHTTFSSFEINLNIFTGWRCVVPSIVLNLNYIYNYCIQICELSWTIQAAEPNIKVSCISSRPMMLKFICSLKFTVPHPIIKWKSTHFILYADLTVLFQRWFTCLYCFLLFMVLHNFF